MALIRMQDYASQIQMVKNYYPWNVQALAAWLKQELAFFQDSRALAARLKVTPFILQNWLISPIPDITLDQIHSIAEYRNWNIQQTIQWLGLQPAHMATLIAQSPPGYNVGPGNETQLVFHETDACFRG